MEIDFKTGERIRVTSDHHWAMLATGKIANPPDAVVKLSDNDWNGCKRRVNAKVGQLLFYWVCFDEAHTDNDGDGPYSEAEIESDYLKLI